MNLASLPSHIVSVPVADIFPGSAIKLGVGDEIVIRTGAVSAVQTFPLSKLVVILL